MLSWLQSLILSSSSKWRRNLFSLAKWRWVVHQSDVHFPAIAIEGPKAMGVEPPNNLGCVASQSELSWSGVGVYCVEMAVWRGFGHFPWIFLFDGDGVHSVKFYNICVLLGSTQHVVTAVVVAYCTTFSPFFPSSFHFPLSLLNSPVHPAPHALCYLFLILSEVILSQGHPIISTRFKTCGPKCLKIYLLS